MSGFRAFIIVIATLAGIAGLARADDGSRTHAVDGLITKPSAYSVDVTLDCLERALKERGFMIFARLDHAAAAASVGLKMPRETVLVFGNPRLGTPNFLKYPRERPVCEQRLRTREGDASRGIFCSLITAASTSSGVERGLLMIFFAAARRSA